MSLFVGNLSSHVQHRDLENAFRRFGRCNLELKEGYGFVVYEEYRDAERALKSLHGRSICRERPSLSWAKRHRPFQRFSGKGNSFKRGSWDRTRRHSGSEKDSDNDEKNAKPADDLKDVSPSEGREDAVDITEREEEWKDPGTEPISFDEVTKNVDPLDSGRWGEPLSDGSPERAAGGSMREDEDLVDVDGREDGNGSLKERSHGSPVDKSRTRRSSREFRNSYDHHRRGRDETLKPQERCYNCGQFGHVKRNCRARMNVNMHPRDGFDNRRNQFRNPRGLGFRGMGGRFRGIDRRVFNRDIQGNYGRRNLRTRDTTNDRKFYEPPERAGDKRRRKHHRSDSRRRDSPRESRERSSRERSKRKHKKSRKKSSHSSKKRRRSSSNSPSPSSSHSHGQSSSSSLSRSRSRSCTSSSSSRSSKSRSRSRSSSCPSQSIKSQSRSSSRSRSRSVRSRSRLHSASSRSVKSTSKSQSPSSRSRSRSVSRSHSRHSHSPESQRVPSDSPKIPGSPSNSNAEKRGLSSEQDTYDMPATYKSAAGAEEQEAGGKRAAEKGDGFEYSDDQKMDKVIGDRRSVGSRERRGESFWGRNDTEYHLQEAERLSNGGKHSSGNAKDPSEKIHRSMDSEGYKQGRLSDSFTGKQESMRGSGLGSSSVNPDVVSDIKYSVYKSIMKEGYGKALPNDQGMAYESFGAARLLPLESIVYRRLRRGPISMDNYEKRKQQNEEFGITDKFIRSSSGWWEKESSTV